MPRSHRQFPIAKHRQFDKHETQFSWMAFVKFDLCEVTHSNWDQEPVYDGAYTSCVWHARRGCKSMHDFCYYNLFSNFTSVGYCFSAKFFAKLLLSLIRTLFVWNVWHVTIHTKMWVERKRERERPNLQITLILPILHYSSRSKVTAHAFSFLWLFSNTLHIYLMRILVWCVAKVHRKWFDVFRVKSARIVNTIDTHQRTMNTVRIPFKPRIFHKSE